ncbi:MAG: ATP-binding cassette domain-containing protein [Anaerolineaceae bacterium]|nr:ATP-binding cassette domain-containing protein [Anaerolineaceae bacterium]
MSRAAANVQGGPKIQRREFERFARPLQWSIIRRMLSFMRPYRVTFVLGLLLSVLAAGLNVCWPLLLKQAIDVDIPGGDINGLLMTAAGMLGLLAASYVCSSLASYILGLNRERVQRDLRQACFDKVQAMDMSYFDRTPVGWLIARGHSDVRIVCMVMTRMASLLVRSAAFFAGASAMMIWFNWQLALVVLAVAPLMYVASDRYRRKARPAWRRVRRDISRLTANVAEMVSGVRVVQAFTREDENLGQYDSLNLVNARSFMRTARYQGWYLLVIEVLSVTAVTAVLGWGCWQVAMGALMFGTLVAFWRWIGMVFQPIRELAHGYNHVLQAMAAGERVFGLLDRPPRIQDAPGAVALPRIRGQVCFDQVSFEYLPGTPVLEDISFEVPPATTVALVGHTGSGKTTIVSLVNRFYDVTSGSVTIDGYDVRQVTQESLHTQTGLILQENFLFDGSVMENIKFARPETGDDEVIRLCKVLGCHHIFERLALGYQTQVGERGENLSAGQRQLVSIARAMVADPRILMLDEATSSVDTQTELAIQYALERLIERRTSFIVAHRLSTVRRADQILVLDHGRIVERGTHQQLIELGGVYAALHEEFMKIEDEDE